MKQSADDSFKCDENSRKFSKRVENTVGKGSEQFLLFPLCFQKACFAGASKSVIVWKWAKMSSTNTLHFYKPSSQEMVENTSGKGELACNKQYLLFPHKTFQKTFTADTSKSRIVWERVNKD